MKQLRRQAENDMWDARYSEPEYAYGTEPNDFLRTVAPRLTVGDAVCLAEGQGRNAVYLASLGHRVNAVDSSKVGLDRARQLATQRGVSITTTVADLQDFDLGPGSVDLVVSIFAHVLPGLRKVVHQRLVSWLRPGGQLVLEAYTPRQLELKTGGPTDVARMMTLSDLHGELPGLRFELGQELERNIQEGTYHQGRSHVVQIFAVKD